MLHRSFATLSLSAALLLVACPETVSTPADADSEGDVAGEVDGADGDAGDTADGGPNVRTAGPLELEIRVADGTFDLRHDARAVFERATADVLLDDGAGPRLVSFAGDCARSIDAAGRLVCAANGVTLALELALDGEDGHVEALLTVTNTSAATVQVLRLAPWVVEAERGGALWLGADPARHRVLENGSWIALDHAVQVNWGDAARFILGDGLPIPLRGGSVANWNHLVADLDDPSQALVAGWLSFERAVPTVGIGFDADAARAGDAGGAFTTYAAECALIFSGKPLAPGASLASERFWLQPFPGDPLAGLEHYADAVAAYQGIVPWPERDGGQPVPNGWNSWTGSGGTGGYGTNIDEQLIVDNLTVFADQLGPFGGGWFQLDDGWEPYYGDWSWNTERFPDGGAGMAAAIRARGMRPGLWIAPFSVDPDSELAAAHPEWLQKKGQFNFSSDGWKTIDSSNPEVLDWLDGLFTTVREDGWDWVKLDFSYQALIDTPGDATLTNIESWRQGWRAVRDALGPDVFLLGIGAMGPNIGLLDAMRTTLDNNPQWDGDDPDDPVSAINSFKSTVRTGSRRWFYQDRIWVNHPDLIFFRSSTEAGVPPLSFEESRTFATWVGLGGGIVKLGDKLVDMAGHPEWIDVVRRLLPAWPAGARPVDVLVRDYPERWVLPIDAPAGAWTVVGLLNWGTNRDHTTRPPLALPDGPRAHAVTCDGECLVWELWTEAFLGMKSGAFTVEVPARDSRVLALRTPTGAPQLLGTNRHVTMGATDLGPMAWDAGAKTLSGTLTGAVGTEAAPWEYRLAFYAPAPFAATSATVAGVDAPALSQDGEVVGLTFALPAGAQDQVVAWQIAFE